MAARMACLLIVAHGTRAHCLMRASCLAKPTPAMLRSAVPPRLMRPPVLMASERSAAKLTRTPRGLRTVRTGYAYQPPACCTYLRRRAVCPGGRHYCMYAVRVPA